jgi:antitoxin component of MazEF toxin-antitoxin module
MVYPPKKGSMQASRWGNSLAVRLPAAVVEALGLQEGDEIAIEVAPATPRRPRPAPRRGARNAAHTWLDPPTRLPLQPHGGQRARRMSSPFFLDTNVLLYATMQSDPRSEAARAAGASRHHQRPGAERVANVASRKLRRPWSEITRALAAIRALCPPPL